MASIETWICRNTNEISYSSLNGSAHYGKFNQQWFECEMFHEIPRRWTVSSSTCECVTKWKLHFCIQESSLFVDLYCNNIIKAQILVFTLDVPFSSSTKLSRPFGGYLVGTTHPPPSLFHSPKTQRKRKKD